MKKLLPVFVLWLMPVAGMAQKVYELPVRNASEPATEVVSDRGGIKNITGVSQPSITVYLPDEKISTGTAVILCPGGGMRALSWTTDVEQMAQYLNARGIAAIGLKYRLNNGTSAPRPAAQPGAQPAAQAMPMTPMPRVGVTGFESFPKANANPMPSDQGDRAIMNAIEDGMEAVRLVRQHAKEWNIDPAKVGYLGFSAGGGVAIGATVKADAETMPNFLMTAYGPSLIDVDVPANAPDLLIMTRVEHQNVAAGCLGLFLEWKKAGKNAELHMYADGNGPFTLNVPGNNTTGTWSQAMISWMTARGFAK